MRVNSKDPRVLIFALKRPARKATPPKAREAAKDPMKSRVPLPIIAVAIEKPGKMDPERAMAILGLREGFTKRELTVAFRKTMLLYHVERYPDATPAEKQLFLDISKGITLAKLTLEPLAK